MISKFNEEQMIDRDTENHYRFHTFIEEGMFPQVHDFFEFSLMVSGQMELTVGQTHKIVKSGAFTLIRPKEIHNKKQIGECSYINLAFSAQTVQSLFSYLGCEPELQALLDVKDPLTIQLSPGETLLLRSRMESLNRIPHDQYRLIRTQLRRLLLECMADWFIPLARKDGRQSDFPQWFQDLLQQMNDPVNIARGIEFMTEYSKHSSEHLCRSFRKYMGVSPHAYLTARRLNYAANMLRHSDHSIQDIGYEAGFQSESAFYHNFRKEYGVSPGVFRKAGASMSKEEDTHADR